jgi:proline iminopeptidase
MQTHWRKNMIYGLVGFVAICVVIIAGALIWRVSLQTATRSARANIDPKVGIDELFKTEIGGIQQWVHARGVNRSDPVLLYLHGGPGTSMMAFESMFQNPLEQHFIVVHWDQRGVGKTYRENPNLDYAPTVTYDRMIKDASEMLDLVRKRYGKEKIIVLGHSWGSMLALGLLDVRSDGIAAYVGTGQLIDAIRGQVAGYAVTLAEAKKQNNLQAVKALESIAPYPDKTSELTNPKVSILQEWQQFFGFAISRRYKGSISNVFLTNALKSPEYSLLDVATFLDEGSGRRWPILDREIYAFNTSKFNSTYQVPMFLMLGRHDWQTPSTVAADWLETIQAPMKQVFWFEDSAHAPMVDEPELFAQTLISEIRPLALNTLKVPANK